MARLLDHLKRLYRGIILLVNAHPTDINLLFVLVTGEALSEASCVVLNVPLPRTTSNIPPVTL